MVLKLPKIVHFLQICPGDINKPKYIKAIYFSRLKDLIKLFQKIVFFIGVWDINSSWDIKESDIKKSTDSAEI